MKRQFGAGGLYQGICLYNFVDNHDVSRVANLLKRKENLENVYTLLYMMPGVPSIYYGSEWGIEGEKGQGMDADLPLRPELSLEEMQGRNTELIRHIQKLAECRKNSRAVRYGSYKEVLVKNEQLVFARREGEEYRIVALNLSEQEAELYFSYGGQEYQLQLAPFTSEILEEK